MSSTSRQRETIATSDAALLLLHAQGLFDDPTKRAGPAAVRRLIDRLGFVQIDSINVLERAHHLTLFSRLHGYEPRHLAHLHETKRDLFEHWTHDASLLPVSSFHWWHHRRRRFVLNPRVERWIARRLGKNRERLFEEILLRIEREGPLQSRDFERDSSSGGSSAWWGWKPAKAALEYLWWRGDLSVAARVNFQKVYDLTPRVYPDHCDLEAPDEASFIDWCCREALERLVIATPGELAAFFGAVTPKEARRWHEQARKRRDVVDVNVESCDGSPPRAAMALPDWTSRLRRAKTAAGRRDGDLRLLSPFDPVVRDRQRLERLFGFNYRFEAFVPAPKRVYGYYVLPIFAGGRFVGRCEFKNDRRRDVLVLKGLWWEDDIRPTKDLGRRFDEAAERLREFIDAGRISREGTR